MENCSRQVVDEKIDVQMLGRAARDAKAPQPAKSLGKKVAIIGGGPGGMNAAWQLARAGVEAHIFEKGDKLGGKLAQVIPWERLPKAIWDAEIARFMSMKNIKVNFGVNMTKTKFAELKKKYDHVIVAVGTPTAYLLATRSFRGRRVMMTLIELPLVVPPAVAGIGLLAAFGPAGLLGGPIGDLGVALVFETAGVIVALTFVASPFYMRQAQAAFEAVDADWLGAARTLGAGEARAFISVAVPAAAPGLLAGGALAWGRALGEFGATIIFAGSLQGVTQTAPLAILELFASDFDAALALSAVLVALSAALLATIKLLAPSEIAARPPGGPVA